MSALSVFAHLLGIADRQAEDALHSEDTAKLVVGRRGFIAVTGLVAAGSVFSFAKTRPNATVHMLVNGQVVRGWYPGDRVREWGWQNNDSRNAVIEIRRARGTGFLDKAFVAPGSRFVWSAHSPETEIIATR